MTKQTTKDQVVTDSTFEELAIERTVFLFTSPTSGHSKLMTDRLAKIDCRKYVASVADCLAVCAKFGINSVPTLAIFENNEPVVVRKGLVPEDELKTICLPDDASL